MHRIYEKKLTFFLLLLMTILMYALISSSLWIFMMRKKWMNEIPNFNSPDGCRFVFVVVVFFFHAMLPLSIVGLFVNDSGNWERKTEYKRKKNTNFYSWFMGENRNWPAFSIITNQILSQFFFMFMTHCVCVFTGFFTSCPKFIQLYFWCFISFLFY